MKPYSKGIIELICEKSRNQTIPSPMYPIGSLVPPKKNVITYSTGKILQGPSKLAIWNCDISKLKNGISLLLKGVQSSITTLKCSEDSHYGVRIRVLKSSDFPFPSYGPRPFFGTAILAENWKIYIISNLFELGVVSYVYWYQKSIATVCLKK